jgi:hypothetical protein
MLNSVSWSQISFGMEGLADSPIRSSPQLSGKPFPIVLSGARSRSAIMPSRPHRRSRRPGAQRADCGSKGSRNQARRASKTPGVRSSWVGFGGEDDRQTILRPRSRRFATVFRIPYFTGICYDLCLSSPASVRYNPRANARARARAEETGRWREKSIG